VDIIETYGFPQFLATTYLHWKTPAGQQYVGGTIANPESAAGWHTFALSWTKTQLTWLIDGVVVQTANQNIPQQKMYLIANLAEWIGPEVAARSPGQCDGTLNIRSVTLWPA
jgi:beta-glucanase (GH16 family)